MDELTKFEGMCETGIRVSWAGLEPYSPVDQAQVIDFRKRQKRSNRSFRRFEVHGGYTGYEFLNSGDVSLAECGNDFLPANRRQGVQS